MSGVRNKKNLIVFRQDYGSMTIYGYQQVYSEEPIQCCLYVGDEKCALLCNQPQSDEPRTFKGQGVPCPGESDPPPTKDATK